MELSEFAVMLLQAPAEAITQSVIYARQNKWQEGILTPICYNCVVVGSL